MDPTDSKIPALGVHDNTVAESSTLRESLIFSMVPSQLDLGQLYIPAGRLQSLLSPEQITSELEKLNISLDAESLLTFVTSHAPNIFGILVYIRAESRIVDFYTKNVRDADLPFHRDSKDKVTIEDKDTDKFTVFADWSETEEKEFLDAQWRFCVPQFSPTTEIVDYPTRTIFPFSVGMAKGALDSMVRQVRVHPEHGSASLDPVMALKEIEMHIDEAGQITRGMSFFQREVATLQHLATNRSKGGILKILFSDHVIRLHSAFIRDRSLYMLLPWARRGTLGDLWNKTDPKDATLQWFSQQVVALVGVANLLYKLDCRHGDYKPENILVFDEFEPTAQPISEEVAGGLRLCRFEDGDERVLKEKSLGDLVAADFDSAKVNETATKDRDITHGYLSDRRYEPPERHPDHPDHDKAGSRRCDVWCLGCVFLEFVIWKCWGKSGVDAFNDDLGNKSRGGFWVREDGFKVHTAVQKWSSKIRGLQDDRSQERLDGLTSVEQAYILRLLDVIMTEMLIVRIRTDAKGEGTCRSDLPGIYQNIMENDLGGDWTELINMITPNTMEGDIE